MKNVDSQISIRPTSSCKEIDWTYGQWKDQKADDKNRKKWKSKGQVKEDNVMCIWKKHEKKAWVKQRNIKFSISPGSPIRERL